MYSKQENQKLKQEFWVAFAQKYPKKWVLYDTKIKDFSFKFFVDNTKAQVSIEIEHRNDDKRYAYFEKLEALKAILEDEFIKDLVFQKNHTLENGKTISKIWVEQLGISVSNRSYWDMIFDFFFDKMNALELFYLEYDEFIKDIEWSLAPLSSALSLGWKCLLKKLLSIHKYCASRRALSCITSNVRYIFSKNKISDIECIYFKFEKSIK